MEDKMDGRELGATASGEPSSDSTARQVYEDFNNTLHAFDQVYSDYAGRMGLSDSALEVLWSVYDLGEGCLQRDVCADMCIGKQTVNSSVHKLVDQGILRLEPAATGRGMRLFLTDEGRVLVQERIAPLAEADFAAFAELPEADRQVFGRFLRSYLQSLKTRLASVPAPQS